MSHGDDKGLILPPAIAPIHVVVVPIWKTAEDKQAIESYIQEYIIVPMKQKYLHIASEILGEKDIPIIVRIDRDDQKSPGRKYNQYELQ